ncbi:MAG: hypothetical protein L0Z62_38295 [Gemmataceae bacterium]|nr:hypothetical protein [Gemmataceae bacterium]
MTLCQRYRTQEEVAQVARAGKLMLWGGVGAAVVILLSALVYAVFLRGGPRTGTTDPEAKSRLERLQELYQRYTRDHKGKPPPNENTFKEYIKKIPKQDRDAMKIPDEVDSLFVSPRDGQKYTIRYGVRLHPSGDTEALAWETTGTEGNRFVLLNIGYVQEYGDADFKDLKKK